MLSLPFRAPCVYIYTNLSKCIYKRFFLKVALILLLTKSFDYIHIIITLFSAILHIYEG